MHGGKIMWYNNFAYFGILIKKILHKKIEMYIEGTVMGLRLENCQNIYDIMAMCYWCIKNDAQFDFNDVDL